MSDKWMPRNHWDPRNGFFGFWLFGHYVRLKSGRHCWLFSERNHVGTTVIPLPFGWRLSIKHPEEDASHD